MPGLGKGESDYSCYAVAEIHSRAREQEAAVAAHGDNSEPGGSLLVESISSSASVPASLGQVTPAVPNNK